MVLVRYHSEVAYRKEVDFDVVVVVCSLKVQKRVTIVSKRALHQVLSSWSTKIGNIGANIEIAKYLQQPEQSELSTKSYSSATLC